MAKKVIDKDKLVATEGEIGAKAIIFVGIKESIKKLNGELKPIDGELREYLSNAFVEDAKGNQVCVVKHAGKEVFLTNTRRVSTVMRSGAEDVLKRHLPKALEKVTVIRDDVVEEAYQKGEIGLDVIKQIYAEDVSYAFSVKVKDAHDSE